MRNRNYFAFIFNVSGVNRAFIDWFITNSPRSVKIISQVTAYTFIIKMAYYVLATLSSKPSNGYLPFNVSSNSITDRRFKICKRCFECYKYKVVLRNKNWRDELQKNRNCQFCRELIDQLYQPKSLQLFAGRAITYEQVKYIYTHMPPSSCLRTREWAQYIRNYFVKYMV